MSNQQIGFADTGFSTVESTVEAIRPGAYHFLPKAFSEDKPHGFVLSALKETLGRSAVNRDAEQFQVPSERAQVVVPSPCSGR